ncbi:helix-turn-helix domain-containing protein [Bhargavaea ullalensis]
MNVAKAVNSTLDLSELFELTLKESIRAIRDADGGALFLFEPRENHLICRSHVNFNEDVEQIRLKAGESFTGTCFSTRKPVLLRSLDEITAETQSMSETNLRLLDHSVALHPSKNSFRAMSVPLISATDQCIGVITLNGFDPEGTFSEEDLKLLQVISDQAATALEKARLHEELKSKNDLLEQILDFQQDLLLQMNLGSGLDAMLERLAVQIQKPLSLFTVYGESFETEASGNGKLLTEYLVRNGSRLIGKLLVYGDDGQALTETEQYFLQQSILYFALEINRAASIREVEQSFKKQLLDDLLSGMLTDDFIDRAQGLGLAVSGAFLPVAAETTELLNGNTIEGLVKKQDFMSFLQLEINRRFPGSLVIQNEQAFLLLLSVESGTAESSLNRQIRLIADEADQYIRHRRISTSANFAIGRPVEGMEKLPDSIEFAFKTLRLMKTTAFKGNVADRMHFGLERLLLHNSGKDIEAFLESTLGPLLEGGDNKNEELLKTLTTFMRHIQRPGAAAKELHIHPNTLQYRLKQIAKLLNVDFQNAEAVLNMQLACRLLEGR